MTERACPLLASVIRRPRTEAEHKCRQIVLLICGYGIIALTFNIMDEVVPIYASTPISHSGLSLDSSELGLPLSIGGIGLMVTAVFIYPRIQKVIGSQRCARLLSLKP